MSRWPVAGPSEYGLLASSPASKLKKKQFTHSTTNTHKITTHTQDNYSKTHNCDVSLQKFSRVPPSVPARGWPLLTFFVTTINMRIVFYYKLFEYADCPQQIQLIVTQCPQQIQLIVTHCNISSLGSWRNFSHRNCTVYTNWRKGGVFICCVCCTVRAHTHTHLSVSQLAVCSYSELHTKCLYDDTKRKENVIHYFHMLFVLNFLTINTVYSCSLIVSTAECFLALPLHSKADNIVLPRWLS